MTDKSLKLKQVNLAILICIVTFGFLLVLGFPYSGESIQESVIVSRSPHNSSALQLSCAGVRPNHIFSKGIHGSAEASSCKEARLSANLDHFVRSLNDKGQCLNLTGNTQAWYQIKTYEGCKANPNNKQQTYVIEGKGICCT